MGFLKKGKREERRRKLKASGAKKHLKSINTILNELEKVAYYIIKIHDGQPWTEELVKERATDYMGREPDSMELNIILSKLAHASDWINARMKEEKYEKEDQSK